VRPYLTIGEGDMPYIRDRDFARIKELLATIKELTKKGENDSVPDIAARALKVMARYIVEREEEE